MRNAEGEIVPFTRLPLEKQAAAWRAKLRNVRCAACGQPWKAHQPGCRYAATQR